MADGDMVRYDVAVQGPEGSTKQSFPTKKEAKFFQRMAKECGFETQLERVNPLDDVVWDQERRKQATQLGLLGAGAGATLLAVKFGAIPGVSSGVSKFLPASKTKSSADSPPTDPAPSNLSLIPSTYDDPGGAAPGSIWYREDLGLVRFQSGILGVLSAAPLDPTYGTVWANPISASLESVNILYAGLAKVPVLAGGASGQLILDPTNAMGVYTSHNTLDDTAGNMLATGSMTATTYYGELDTATLGAYPFAFAGITTGDVLYFNGTDWVNDPIAGVAVTSLNGLTGAITIQSANAGIVVTTLSPDITLTLGELDYGTLGGAPIVITGLSPNDQLLYYNGTSWVNSAELDGFLLDGEPFSFASLLTGDFLYFNGSGWANQALVAGTGISTSGATITNTGVTSLASANGGISVSTPTGAVTIALGELDNGTLDGAAFSFTALSPGQVLVYDGTNWTNYGLSTGVVSVSNSDGTLVITPTTGNVVASLNLANANSWTALQTFGNDISFGGAQVQVSSLMSGQVLQFNGTYWVNASVTTGVSSIASANTGILVSSPTGAVTLTLGELDYGTLGGEAFVFTSLSADQFLYFDGTEWANSAELDVFTLDAEPFVFSGLMSGDFLYFDGSEWINQALIAGTAISISGATITNTGVTSLASANAGLLVSTSTGAVTLTLGELDYGTLGGSSIVISALMVNDVLVWNGTDWINSTVPATSGVTSLNGLTGALTITSPNSTITVGTAGSDVTVDIALGHANTWTGLQTFGTEISFLGAQVSGSISSGNALYYNGSNWIGQTLVNSLSAGNGISVSGSTGSVTISAVINGSTLLLGSSGLSLNLGNANTWTALQTFGNDISIGGVQFAISGAAKGDLIYENGTNWANLAIGTSGYVLTVSSGLPAWTSLSGITVISLNGLTGALTLTSPNSTLTIGTAGSDVTLDINLSHGNTWAALQKFTDGDFAILGSSTGYTLLESGLTGSSNNTLTLPTTASDTLAALGTAETWTALQTFGTEISFLGAQVSGSISSGNALYYNGSNWVGQTLVNSLSAGNGISVSASTGSVTISAVINGTTLSLGGSGLSLNLGNANTWTALQTFSAGDFAFGGYGHDVITSGATGDIWYYNGTNIVNLAIGSSGYVLAVSSGIPAWEALSGVSVTSVNGLAGAITIQSPNSTLTVGTAGSDINIDINLAHANTWAALQKFTNGDLAILGSSTGYTLLESGLTGSSNNTLTLPTTASDTLAAIGTAETWSALQTFGTEISFLGAQVSGSISNGDVLFYNGSNWIGQVLSGGNGISISSGTTITAVINGTTLLLGSSGLSLNLGNANTWTALQTFGTNLSFLGAQVSGSISSGEVLYYNGSNWIGQAQASLAVSWSSITNPSTTLSLTMAAADTTTFTVQSTTQTNFTWTTSTLTSGMLAAFTLTGSSAVATAASSGSLATFTSTTTGFTAATQTLVGIYSSGSNTNASVAVQGVEISVVNSGTTSTNTALYLTASGASTNYGLYVAAGISFFGGAVRILGTSTGYTTLATANTSGTNYTATLPANTGTIAELNLAQTWSALQTFSAGDFAFGGYGHDVITSGATGDIWYYNGTNIVNLAIGSSGYVLAVSSGVPAWEALSGVAVTSLSAGNGISVSGSTGAVTVSAVINGTTLLLGSSGLSLNLGNANTWTALQTFSAGDFAFGGYGHDVITSGAKGDIWYYNGTNIVNLPVGSTGNVLTVSSGVPAWEAVTSLTVPWSGLTNPSTSLSLTMAAADTTTFTVQSTTQTNFTWTTSTLTSGMLAAFTLTGSSAVATAASSGSLVTFTSTTTGFTGATQTLIGIYSSGSNTNPSVVVQGMEISVVNSGTTSTNTALYLTASGASTNYGLYVAAGISFFGANLELLGTSTGYTAITTANTSGTNYTATLPANTGTVAELNLAQTWTALQTFSAGDFAFGGYGHDVITSGAKGDIWYYNGTNIVNLAIGSSGYVLAVSSGVPAWEALSGVSVTSVNGLVGAITIQSLNSTLTVGVSSPDINIDINLSHANTWAALQKFTNGDLALLGSSTGYTLLESGLTGSSNNTLTLPTTASDTLAALGTAETWTALQTFGTEISFMGAQVSGSISSGNLLLYNGSNWIGQSLSGGNGINISSSTTITAVINGTTLSLGSSGLSLNLGNANTWTALQTFGTQISFLGAQVSGSIATGDVLYYNGSNWIGQLQGSLAVSWSSLTAPTTTLSLTMPAGDETTFTVQSTSQTGFTWTSLTITSGMLAAFSLTGSSVVATAASSGSVATFSSATTGFTAATQTLVGIYSSGANTNNPVTVQGLEVSVTNTNSSAGTNVALYLVASGAHTTNTALQIHAGQILSDAAQTWALKSNTALDLVVTDGTNAYLTLNTQTGTDNITNVTLAVGSAISYASAAGSSHSLLGLSAYTLTLTGATGVTALNGLALNAGQPTVTDSTGMTVTTASTVYIAGAPTAGGSAIITNAYSINVAAGLAYFGGGISGSGNTGALTAGTGILNTANSWTALQTFGTNLSFLGAQVSGSISNGEVLFYNGSNWIGQVLSGGNGISISSGTTITAVINGTTLLLGSSGLSLNLGNANTWTALQTFGTEISFLGAQVSGSIATGNYLYYNGTNWIAQNIYTGTTLTSTAGQLSINLGNANTWTALQTFGTNISFLGAQVSGSISSGEVLYYNGSNWIGQAQASLAVAWSSLTNPSTSLSLTMAAADTTTFTVQSTTQTSFTWTTSTLTSGMLAAFTLTGSSAVATAASSGSLATFTSTTTGFTAATQTLIGIYSSGANTNNPVVVQGLEISVTNTNSSAGTNVGLYLVASGAHSVNTALQIHAGQMLSDAAQTWALPANTSPGLQLTDGTNAYYTLTTSTGATTTPVHQFAATAASVASAAGVQYMMVMVPSYTFTLTGTTTVTALHGMMLWTGQPTVTDTSAVTVSVASTLSITGPPVAAGSVTITAAYALEVQAGLSYFGGNLVLLGSSTGTTTIATANASGTSYTATLPANTGTIAELNLAQTWSALQTFGNNISVGGATVSMSGLATGNVVYYNGTNWINLSLTSPNSTISLTASSTVHGVDINLGHANTWTALQTFTAGDFAFGGYGHDVITSGATGDIWYYNGTNIVNLAIGTSAYVLTVASGVPTWAPAGAATSVAWSAITNPGGSLSLTMAAADTTTFTIQSTSQTNFTWTSSTLTTGSLALFQVTGTSNVAPGAGTGALASFVSTSTFWDATTAALVAITSSGANHYIAAGVQGLVISITNTNGTSGTNYGLYVTASGATTNNWAVYVAGGNTYIGGYVAWSQATYSAAGANQGAATAITTASVIITGGTSTQGLILPAGVPDGTQIVVQNNNASNVLLYPNSGANIDGGAANAAVTFYTPLSVTYIYQASTTTWYSATDDTYSNGSITTTHNAGGFISLALNLSNTNSWAALQTFGNNISFGGATLNVSALASGNVLQYNGTNWVNIAVNSLGVTPTWNSLVAPTGSLAMTIPAADTTIFTLSATSQTAFTWTTSTLTSGVIAAFTSTGTALSGAPTNLVTITSSGANGSVAVGVAGLAVSITNTNGTSGTNYALYLTASGATTNNWAAYIAAGNVYFGGYQMWHTATYSAAGTTQGTATPITTAMAFITAGTTTQGVLLPVPVDGQMIFITNNAANSVLIYPNSGANIDGGSTNAATTLQTPLNVTLLYQASTTTWWSIVDDTYGSATITTTHNAGGTVSIALNLANANTWSALQTFGTEISFLGAQVSGSIASTDVLQYNGSNWIGVLPNSLGVTPTWNSLVAPTGSLAMTIPAADTTTFTLSATSQTAFTWTSSTLTTGILAAFTFAGTTLAGSTNPMVTISSSGANTDTGIVAQGLSISVTNTNGTSGTNTAILLAASGAMTANYAIDIHAGGILSEVATTWAHPANTASAFLHTDGTNAYYTLNTQTTTSAVAAHTFGATAVTIASAAGVTYNVMSHSAFTLTLSGTTTVTAIQGLSTTWGQPTIATSGAGITVTTASTLYIAGAPVAGTSVTITSAYSLYVSAGSAYFGGGITGSGSVGALTESWSNLTAPGGTLSITFPAADTTTFTLSASSQTAFTWTSTTLTSGILAVYSVTGSSAVATAASSGSLVTFTSTTTGFTAATQTLVGIYSSGANTNNPVVVQGLLISVTNTNTTAGTNVALVLTASGAHTTNTALDITTGQILSGAAQTWALPSNTALDLVITDGTNTYVTLNTQTGADNTTNFIHAVGTGISYAAASGSTHSNVGISAYTLTLTGATGVTALNGLQLSIGQPTVTDTTGMTVVTASTVYIAGAPAVGSSALITNAYSINVAAGLAYFGGGISGSGSVGALTESWSNLTAPTTTLAITFPAADTTTFTYSATSQTANLWTSSTLTSGMIQQYSITGTSAIVTAAASGSLMTFTSSATGYTAAVQRLVGIYSSGSNSNASTMQGLAISVTNAGSSSVNTALYLTSSGASTNTAVEINAGQILSDAAQTWALKSNTALDLVVTDGTNAYVTVNTQTGTDNTTNFIHAVGTATGYAAAAGSTHSNVGLTAYTLTLTGATGVTALNGLQLNIGQPTVTDTTGMTVVTASTVYIAGAPAVGSSALITNAYSINVAAGLAYFGGGISGSGSVGSLTEAWSNLTAPTGTLAITFPAADTTTFTYSATSQTANLWTSTTLTSGMLHQYSITGSSAVATAASSGSLMTFTSTTTGFTAATQTLVGIYSSGANTNNPVVVQGLAISVTNTNGTAGTNAALYLIASGAHSVNTAIQIHAGQILSDVAQTWALPSNTALDLVITDGTNAYVTLNTQTGADNTTNFIHAVGTGISYAAASGSSHVNVSLSAYTLTLTGTTGVTALNGLQLYIGAPIVTDTSATTITSASTIYIGGPPSTTGSATITNANAILFAGASKIAFPSNTAATAVFTDGTNAYYTLNTQTATNAVAAHTFTVGTAVTLPSATATLYNAVAIPQYTLTISGTSTVTSFNGISLYVVSPIVADSSGGTVTTASTVYISGAPSTSGSAVITNAYAFYVSGGLSYFGGQINSAVHNGTNIAIDSGTAAASAIGSITIGSSGTLMMKYDRTGPSMQIGASADRIALVFNVATHSTGLGSSGGYQLTDSANSSAIGSALALTSLGAIATSANYTLYIQHTGTGSDARLKPDFQPYASDPIAELMTARFGQHQHMKNYDGTVTDYGRMRAAVDARSLPSTITDQREDGMFMVISPFYEHWMVGVMQAQQREIQELREQVTHLSKRLGEKPRKKPPKSR